MKLYIVFYELQVLFVIPPQGGIQFVFLVNVLIFGFGLLLSC